MVQGGGRETIEETGSSFMTGRIVTLERSVSWLHELESGDGVSGIGRIKECDGPFFTFVGIAEVWVAKWDLDAEGKAHDGLVHFGESTFGRGTTVEAHGCKMCNARTRTPVGHGWIETSDGWVCGRCDAARVEDACGLCGTMGTEGVVGAWSRLGRYHLCPSCSVIMLGSEHDSRPIDKMAIEEVEETLVYAKDAQMVLHDWAGPGRYDKVLEAQVSKRLNFLEDREAEVAHRLRMHNMGQLGQLHKQLAEAEDGIESTLHLIRADRYNGQDMALLNIYRGNKAAIVHEIGLLEASLWPKGVD